MFTPYVNPIQEPSLHVDIGMIICQVRNKHQMYSIRRNNYDIKWIILIY